ncbi:MAG: ABC transporter ATP-binding protein, partial [Dehalococcoidia bacterium]|nr:ABC transporter ATP-binding protein [Dehalococcoidia bacterium]
VREIFTVREEIRADGVAVILVEQNVDHALKFEDLAYVLENGRIVLKGKGHDLLQDQHLQRAYLGVT